MSVLDLQALPVQPTATDHDLELGGSSNASLLLCDVNVAELDLGGNSTLSLLQCF
ncbi:MAG: Lanthionine-containing peptide SapB precursor RamS [Acidimicrobiaceae bacterium]|jgi:hypothetical protein